MAQFKDDAFESHGYYCTFLAYVEIQINDTGEAARYRMTIFNPVGENIIHCGYWQPIRFDKNGRSYIKDWHGNVAKGKPDRTSTRLYLDHFLRTKNNPWI